jgi:hypothetical protein
MDNLLNYFSLVISNRFEEFVFVTKYFYGTIRLLNTLLATSIKLVAKFILELVMVYYNVVVWLVLLVVIMLY